MVYFTDIRVWVVGKERRKNTSHSTFSKFITVPEFVCSSILCECRGKMRCGNRKNKLNLFLVVRSFSMTIALWTLFSIVVLTLHVPFSLPPPHREYHPKICARSTMIQQSLTIRRAGWSGSGICYAHCSNWNKQFTRRQHELRNYYRKINQKSFWNEKYKT